MGHKNAPLTPEGRRRLIERVLTGRPIAHVADEGGVSRQTLSKWVARYLAHGEAGLEDRSSRPGSQPNRTPDDIEQMVIALRQATKWGPDRISAFLRDAGDGEVGVSPATVWRILQRNGINTLRMMDVPTGETKRAVNRYEHPNPGDMVHIDVKKVGRIPDGGGWFVHGRGTDEARQSNRVANRRPGKAHIHAAVDDHSRLAYAEVHPDEKKETASAFWVRTVAFYRRHGIDHIARCLTDNGPAYRSKLFNDTLGSTGTTHKYTRPHTPRTNGKVERFNQTMKVEWLYVRSYMSDDERTAALADFLNHYNHERPHASLGHKPPASRVPETSFRIAPQPAEFDAIEPDPEEYLF